MNRVLLLTLSTFVSFNSFSQDLAYPDLYQGLNLPQYENASITDLGRESESLRDGIKIFLESTDDYTALRTYYESKMSGLGWELKESIAVKKMREMGKLDMIPFSGVFEKENMTFQIFSSRVGAVTKINIAVVEK